MCAGDTNFIRVWDMNKELYKEYATEANSGITTMTSSDQYTVAGFGDGSLRLFDFRCSNASVQSMNHQSVAAAATTSRLTRPSTSATVKPFYNHDAYVLKVNLHKRNSPKLVTAGIYGGINVFDMRTLKSDVDSLFNREYVTALQCHPVNELIAV